MISLHTRHRLDEGDAPPLPPPPLPSPRTQTSFSFHGPLRVITSPRVSSFAKPCEKRSAWGGGWEQSVCYHHSKERPSPRPRSRETSRYIGERGRQHGLFAGHHNLCSKLILPHLHYVSPCILICSPDSIKMISPGFYHVALMKNKYSNWKRIYLLIQLI